MLITLWKHCNNGFPWNFGTSGWLFWMQWNSWWLWNEKITWNSPENILYGIHGMGDGIHLSNMKFIWKTSGSVKTSELVGAACAKGLWIENNLWYMLGWWSTTSTTFPYCHLMRWQVVHMLVLFKRLTASLDASKKHTNLNGNMSNIKRFEQVPQPMISRENVTTCESPTLLLKLHRLQEWWVWSWWTQAG